MTYFLVFFSAYTRDLKLGLEQKRFFEEVVFPLSYLYMIWKRLPKKEREELQSLRERLKKEFEEGQYSDREKEEWMIKGRECAEKFQRSTSCVEGRMGERLLHDFLVASMQIYLSH
jgi:hypothetical protein